MPRLLLTAATTVLFALGAAAPAAAAPYSILQVNLCGSGLAKCFGMGSQNKAGKTAELIRARKPNAVTLNEICANDIATIGRATGFTGQFVQSGTQKCKNGQPYGNGVMFPAGVRIVAAQKFIFADQRPRDAEKRSYICVDGGGVRACATHLDAAGLQEAQAQELENKLATYARAGVPTLLGGDLNLDRGDAQPYVPAGMFRKSDGEVQHVMVTQKQFGYVSTRTLGLDWTDHPGLQVYLDRR